jgi:ribosome maturation factor RimP
MSESVHDVIEACVSRRSAHLLDIVFRGEKGTRVVQVFIDSEEGVTSDLCAEITRDVTSAIDVGGFIEGAYRLEISSPGIERPLRHRWQYRKHIGRRLKVKVQLEGSTEERAGAFISMGDGVIVLAIGKKKEHLSIPFDDIVEARVAPPW